MDDSNLDVDAARNAGVALEEDVFVDYWGFDDRVKHFLPDGKQYFEIQKMNEGQKSAYQKATRSDITVAKTTGDARLKADPAEERKALLMACVTGWNLRFRNKDGIMEAVAFNKDQGPYSFTKWLEKADPVIVEGIEKACRKHNPWLLAEMKSEDIEREIDNLKEMLEVAKKREAGE